MKQRIDWSAVWSEVVVGLILALLVPLMPWMLLGLLVIVLFLVILDTASGGSSLTQIAERIADWLQSR